MIPSDNRTPISNQRSIASRGKVFISDANPKKSQYSVEIKSSSMVFQPKQEQNLSSMQQNSLQSHLNAPKTDKAVKSKVSLEFKEGIGKLSDRNFADLNATDPRARKVTNRSVSGNSFGERTLATARMNQYVEQYQVKGTQVRAAKQVDSVSGTNGTFNSIKIQSAQNTLNFRGNSRGQAILENDLEKADLKAKKSSIGMQVSPLIKKPIMGVKTSHINQSFAVNGVRHQNRQDVGIPFTEHLSFEERTKLINQIANRNMPGQLNHLTGKLMMSQSIMKMNVQNQEQQNIIQFAHQYASQKPLIDQKPGNLGNQPNLVPSKRDIDNISVTGHYIASNSQHGKPQSRKVNANPIPAFIHNSKTITQHYQLNNQPSESTAVNGSGQSFRLPSIQSQKDAPQKEILKNSFASPQIKEKNGLFNQSSNRKKFSDFESIQG